MNPAKTKFTNCTERGDKERYRNDGQQRKKLKNDQKKLTKKLKSSSISCNKRL